MLEKWDTKVFGTWEGWMVAGHQGISRMQGMMMLI